MPEERRLLLHVAKLPCIKAVPVYTPWELGEACSPTFLYVPVLLVHVLKLVLLHY